MKFSELKGSASNTALDTKVDKVAGKGLSTEDYSTADKTKLQNISMTKAGVGLDNVDNTADSAKPISTATLTALNTKAPLTGVGTSGFWPISVAGSASTVPWAGVSDKPALLTIGTTSTTAKAGNYAPAWGDVTGKPAVIAAAATAELARATIGAGTSDLTLGTTATTAKAGNYTPSWAAVTGKPTFIGAGTTAALARIAIGAGTADIASTTAAGSMSAADKIKLDGIAPNATAFSIGEGISAANIIQNTDLNFVSNLEKTNWNSKQAALGFNPVKRNGNTVIAIDWVGGNFQLLTGEPNVYRGTVALTDVQQYFSNSPIFRPTATSSDINEEAALRIENANETQGDENVAAIGFHARGQYGMKMYLRADGFLGIGGGSSPVWRWYSTPTGDMIASGNVIAYSDPRLKENFQCVPNPLGILDKLDGGTFNWKHGIPHTEVKAGKRDYGILANQVQAVMPEIVSESIELEGEKYLTVSYEKLVPVLIEAVKELHARIKELEGK